ncbi:MAG: alpha/beta fold hydrolase [Pseudomonadota bacterium]
MATNLTMINHVRCGFVLVALALTGCDAGRAVDPVFSDPPERRPAATNVELTFTSSGARLPGYLMMAGGAGPHPTALLLHGYPGNEKNLDLALTLRRVGWNVMFMHYRGAWGSEGAFRIAHMREDALAALEHLRQNAEEFRVDSQRLAVIGHSMGGHAALRTGAADANVQCVVGLAAANLGRYADRDAETRAAFVRYSDALFMLEDWDGETGLRELEQRQAEFDLRQLGPSLAGRPVLLLTGLKDGVVPVDVQRDLVAAWQADAVGASLDVTALEVAGDHSFTGHRIAFQRLVVDWLSQNCL